MVGLGPTCRLCLWLSVWFKLMPVTKASPLTWAYVCIMRDKQCHWNKSFANIWLFFWQKPYSTYATWQHKQIRLCSFKEHLHSYSSCTVISVNQDLCVSNYRCKRRVHLLMTIKARLSVPSFLTFWSPVGIKYSSYHGVFH